MKLYRTIKILLLLLITDIQLAFCQTDEEYYVNNYTRYVNHIYKDSIKTVLIHKQGWPLSYPIIYLNGNDGIQLSFDDLSSNLGSYSYTIIHCNADWQPSGIMPADYIDGLLDDRITDYKYSFNTFQPYVHYNISIPNENMRIKLPGNYIFKVFEDFNQENAVLTCRFCVVEDRIEIDAVVKRATDPSRMDTGHEIDFTIKYGGLQITDIYKDIKVFITQNNRWDNAITGLKPTFIRENQLIYDYEDINVFDAGSEYRYFDIKSVRFQSDRINQIVYQRPYFHVQLVPDETRSFSLYYYQKDLNGKYMPEIQEGEDHDTEADYVWVYFTLPYEAPLIDGNIYVFGGLSDWGFDKNYRMEYNYEKKSYQLRLFLKQGYYNYQYAFVKDGSTAADLTFFEGSHYETGNDYVIYVYYRNISERFDRLSGVEIINSLRRE